MSYTVEQKGLCKYKETWWWNDDVGQVVEEKRRLFKIWSKSKCENSRTAYVNAKRKAKHVISKAQEIERKRFCEKLEEADGRGNVFRVAK